MEEDDDDFYGGGGGAEREEQQMDNNDEPQDEMDVTSDGEDDDDDDDSDDHVQFTLERPDGAKAEPPPGSKAAKAQKKETASKAVKIEVNKSTAAKKDDRAGSATPSAAPSAVIKGSLTHNGREGKDFPEVRMSQLDIDQIPTWTNGKPITAVDIDADLAEHSKPWRLPGTDQTDYFNYGFDEYTWTQYCVRQQTMGGTINQLKQDDAQMKAFFGAGGAPGGGGGGQQQAGPPPMPPDMMGMDPQMMAQQMGVPIEFVQQMMQNGGMPPMGGPGMGGPQGGQQGFNQQGGGFGNDVGASPTPQAGQGFQPPSGPGGGQQGGMSMEGLSAQQMAIFQQEQQQQQMGGGHRGGRNRRGRW